MIERLLEMAVDICGLACYALDKKGYLCQRPTHGIVKMRGEWLGYCEGHYQSATAQAEADGFIVQPIVDKRLAEFAKQREIELLGKRVFTTRSGGDLS